MVGTLSVNLDELTERLIVEVLGENAYRRYERQESLRRVACDVLGRIEPATLHKYFALRTEFDLAMRKLSGQFPQAQLDVVHVQTGVPSPEVRRDTDEFQHAAEKLRADYERAKLDLLGEELAEKFP